MQQQATPMDIFLDPVSGWTCWIPRWPADAEPGTGDDPLDGRRRRGLGLVVRLLGAGRARPCRTIWSWWC